MSMFNDNPEKVGVVGLGIIGSRVAECLRGENYHVYVWNRTPKPAPNFLSSPAEIAQLAHVIQIFVTNGEALLSVVGNLAERLTRKHCIVNNSTVDPESVRAAAKIVEDAGASYLDAPFTGSKAAAEKGALVYYVGGNPKVLDLVRPVLEVSSKEIIYCGEVWEAAILKVATNMISAATVEVLSEAYALTVAAGVDPRKLQEAIEHNACGSPLASMKIPTIISQDYEPHFSLKNMFKDAQIALNLANQYQIDLPALSTTASVMFKTMQKGHGDLDYSAVAKNYQSGGGR
ncbi:MAG: NAD(P)-dependent oxidoreductase [Akkermansiaceae bacterium]|nr:NAD(P)-dependent oxidoreductase [Akkermansiaceae bacterium]